MCPGESTGLILGSCLGCETKELILHSCCKNLTETAFLQQVALPFHQGLARHFESAKQYMEAEKFFLRANLAREAVEMYIRANKWEAAHKVNNQVFSPVQL